ncbi:hypothetical protein COW36_17305 [bacterium (Candidatus Blackallbacteria) CG17_big_fil_post_rev_8_21_14_2_50_48_46]|uniref:Uncharacterized protein n=1 Tax=bacterium (Candidatus Blackallbacteria) CG17_big_fil_post_rev_8_21_14_2_50_48_46 TaxID=2014261 RepID=A0A2M7G0E2_9BACT|nr:MAG: hypothetical protein COW64_01425 [bacterium (Candidatus Blackallbacteria) CG18_big_fil_WC_8_21_14_2_50_49_26]PIW15181.1 MAG: hypothetical protein COW36_17305 [bacterium (Candidatus Blackallbacteria) CG17_big_fil_post_rev_8_21_14_2_50_48_46]PIW50142.1 MAG: hypothetical protein COW20_03465 [bacterium (Candidatus Blackallbacteria) CG13_big_fil_rev_8_21_14_2_50_49_14]
MQPSMLDRYNSVAGLNTTQGAQYRVTPENYRQVLGDNADVVLSPKDMKDMYEKGYLDVQRQFTQQESNEGILTIATKAVAALIGPSKSIGAIQIDPKFLDMIKDPNADVGFGYTRLKQESLKALPYPNDPPKPERPARPTEPSLQQTHFEVKTPTQVTEQHRDQLVKFRKEQEQRLQTPDSRYMVEINSSQNNKNVKWDPSSVRSTEEYSHTIKKYENEGAPSLWNGEYVADATWHVAYSEALLQDRDMAVRHQFAERGSIDMNTAIKDLKDGKTGTTAVQRTQQMLDFINKKNGSHLTLEDVKKHPAQVKDGIAKAFGFENFASVQAITKHSVDFRAIGYISTENPKVATESVGQIPKDRANKILNTQLLGHSTKTDGTENYYDTTQLLESRSIDPTTNKNGKVDPGYPELKAAYPEAKTLADVYRVQTETLPIPENAMNEYAAIYSRVSGTPMTEDQMKALNPAPTLKDMYALRAAEYYGKGQIPVKTEGGRVTVPNNKAVTDKILNVRLVLEANNPAGNQVHWFDQNAINAVNGRAEHNFKGVSLTLHDNAGQVVSSDNSSTIERVKINSHDDVESKDTVMWELKQRGNVKDASGAVLATLSKDGKTISDGGGKVIATLSPETGKFEGVNGGNFDSFIEGIAGKFKPGLLEGGVGYGFVPTGGTTSTSVAPVLTQEAEVSGTEMIALAQGKAEPGTVNEIKTALAISDNEIKTALGDSPSPEALQGYLFQRVMTDVMGQSSEQATTALTATKTNKTFTFPEALGTPGQGVKITEPVKTVDVGEPQQVLDLNSVSASLQGNLATMGDLVNNPVVVLNDQDKAGLETLKNQIRSDIAALKANGVETVMIGQTKVKISDLEAQLPEKFAAIDANVAKGDETVRAKMLAQGLSNREEFVGGLNSVSSTDARFADMPPIPPVPAPGSEAATKYPEAIHDSASKFVDKLQEALGDGKITKEEHANMKAWVDTSRQNLANSLGIDVNTLSGVGLSTKLKDKGYSDAQISDITRTVNVLNEAQANINVVPEAVAFDDARKMVSDLRTKIQEFDTVGVVRNAFVGEMKDLAVKTPEKFDATIRGAYQLPPKGESSEADKLVADLTTMAKEGKTPVPPNISFVDPNVIKGANAAFIRNGENNEPTILLSRDLLSKPADLRNALAEEMFHHIEGQTQEYRAQEAFNKLPEDFQAKLKSDPPLSTEALGTEVAKLNPQQQQAYSDYNSAKAGTFDVKGDEGRAGLRALRAAQQGQSVSMIQNVADKARMETSDGVANLNADAKVDGKWVGGYDHGTVTINGKSYQAEFQTAAVESGSEPARSTYADTGLNVTPNNPHATDRTYTEPVSDDNPWGNNTASSPAEASRRSYLSNLDNQIQNFDLMPQVDDKGKALSPEARAQKKQGLVNERNAVQNMTAQDFAATNARNNKIGQLRTALANLEKSPPIGSEGKPISPAQAAQEKIKLENELSTVQNQSAQEFAQQNGMLSQHQMEAKDDSFWGKAREMGGQAVSAMLQMLGSGAVGEVFDRIAQGIENAWKGFYARNTGNSSAADRTQAEDVVQHGFDVGRDGNYDASRTNLINPGGKNAVGQATQQYQQQNPGLTGDRKGFMQQWWESREKGSV